MGKLTQLMLERKRWKDLKGVAEYDGGRSVLVDTNLMGARLDPRLPAGVEDMLVRMLVLGEETAVFIAPPGSF